MSSGTIHSSAPETIEGLSGRFERTLEAFIARAGREAIPNLHDAMAYALGLDSTDPARRGKRIRPVLCLLTAQSLGAPIARAEPFALAIELMHNFCLIHDDIEDGDTMRRGRPSVWIHHGLAHGVNAGDYMLIQAYRAVAEWDGGDLSDAARMEMARLLNETLDRTHIGQALDINARADRDFSMASYIRLVREKTGHYLAAPIQGGAIAAGRGTELAPLIAELAHLLGPMFQIMDDLIDLTEGKGRDGWGSDIREGKRSFLVAHAAGHLPEESKGWFFDVLDRPREETTPEDLDRMRETFESTGAIAAGRAECARLHDLSLGVLARMPRELAAALGPVFESLASRER